MRLVVIFFKRYPTQSIITLLALLFAGLAEGFGLAMLLPLLGLIVNSQGGAGVEASEPRSSLEQFVAGFFEVIGVTPTIGALLAVFVVSISFKAILHSVSYK